MLTVTMVVINNDGYEYRDHNNSNEDNNKITVIRNSIFCCASVMRIMVLMYFVSLTAIGIAPGGSGTVHIYTQTIHRTTQ
jgi:hypothetical protein